MRATLRQAARATVHLFLAAAMAFGSYIFITVLLIAATGAVTGSGSGCCPRPCC